MNSDKNIYENYPIGDNWLIKSNIEEYTSEEY